MNISPVFNEDSGNPCASCSSAASDIVRLKVVAFDLNERLTSQTRVNAKLKLQLETQASLLADPPTNREAIKAISADYERRISSLATKNVKLEKKLKDANCNASKMLWAVRQASKLNNFLNALPQELQMKLHYEDQRMQHLKQVKAQAQANAQHQTMREAPQAQFAEQARQQQQQQQAQEYAQQQQQQAQAQAYAQRLTWTLERANGQDPAQAQECKQLLALAREQAQGRAIAPQHAQILARAMAVDKEQRAQKQALEEREDIERQARRVEGPRDVSAATETLPDSCIRSNNKRKGQSVEVVHASDTDSDKTESDYGGNNSSDEDVDVGEESVCKKKSRVN